MTKAQMINEIIGMAKQAAFLQGKHFEAAEMFFTLAFTPEKELIKICKGLNIISK